MRVFFLTTLVYAAVSVLLISSSGAGVVTALTELGTRLYGGSRGAVETYAPFVLLAMPALLLPRFRPSAARLRDIAYAALAVILLLASFVPLKQAMPTVVPFFADPALARLDSALHFGHDPWRLTHAIWPDLPVVAADWLYLPIWSAAALCFPLILAMDPDSRRARDTALLYLSAWVLIGNVMALGGLSAGPVYYDRLLGGVRFEDLGVALDSSGLTKGQIGLVQHFLWEGYANADATYALGISAFPSVHVAVATVIALYAQQRGRLAGTLGWAFVAIILFLSVWTGFHYAIDGYVSIAVMLALHAVARARRKASATSNGLETAPPLGA